MSGNMAFECRMRPRTHLPDQSFDAVIISNALQIMPDPERALSEYRRVLKDDGVCLPRILRTEECPCSAASKRRREKLTGFGVFSEWSPDGYLACFELLRLLRLQILPTEGIVSAHIRRGKQAITSFAQQYYAPAGA